MSVVRANNYENTKDGEIVCAEQFVMSYLEAQPFYNKLYRDWVTYDDWIKSSGLVKTDQGIDLVVQMHNGELCVIQYEDITYFPDITTQEIRSCSGGSSKAVFTDGITMISVSGWGCTRWASRKKLPHHLYSQPRYAFQPIENGLTTAVHGKLMMDRDSDQVFTSLTITESSANDVIVFLVPKFSLVSQTLLEWTQQSQVLLHSFAEFSDSEVCAMHSEAEAESLGDSQRPDSDCSDLILNEVLQYFYDVYSWLSISKEEIFYYIYGLLHCEAYRKRYWDDVSKELPPTQGTEDYAMCVHVGHGIAGFQLSYEHIPLYRRGITLTGRIEGLSITEQSVVGGMDKDFYVATMRFFKKADPKTGELVDDKSKVAYNNYITIEGIPEKAYDYVINGKPALEWVMEHQAVITHKDLVTASDTVRHAKYPLELFLRILALSLEILELLNHLPKIESDQEVGAQS